MAQVTVLIPVYNKEKYIHQAIQSVINQTFKDWQILIINDSSTDNSLKIIETFLHDNRIQCISLNKNIGLANVLNYALTLINTPFFIQLDADDWLEKNALERQYEAILSAPDVALVYANHKMYWEDAAGQTIKEQLITVEQYKDKYEFLLKINYALVPRFYRTSAVRDIGGWLTQNQGDILAEDVQIILRIAARYKWIWINDVLYHRRKYQENIANFEKSRLLARQYRYELYNQLLLEWGDEYRATWRKIGESYYLQGLEPNRNRREEVAEWIIP